MNLQLSPKQAEAISLLNNPQITELLFGGGAGGGKSLVSSIWMVLECRNYPGIRIGLGRKELTRLKQTTLVTLLREAHPMLGVLASEFKYSDHKGTVQYINGSSIQLFDLARQPSDPDFDTLGSLNLTHVVIEEAGEVVKKAKDVFGSRKNRFLNKKYGITGKTVLTCNPSLNFVRDEFYEPYKAKGAGAMQTWDYGKIYLPDGTETVAMRAFIRSTVADNPFINKNYIETLRGLPPQDRKRLLEGDWDYTEQDNLVISAHAFDSAIRSNLSSGAKYIGVDIADRGADSTVLTLIDNKVIVSQVEIKNPPNSILSERTALEIIKFAQQNGVPAHHIAVDVVGVGTGVRDFLRSRGWAVKEYVAGSRGRPGYRNLRAQTIWQMAEALQKGSLHIYSDLPTKGDLRRQLLAHEYVIEDNAVGIVKKDKIKEMLGRSPDHSDSAVIAYWASSLADNTRIIL